MSPIKDLTTTRRMPRLGKFHLGIKDPQRGFPIKTDYFVIPEGLPATDDIKRIFGDKPKELSILIPVEDEEKWCSQYYRCYSKTRGLVCKGDGEKADRLIDAQTGALVDAGSKEVVWKEMICQGRECPDYKVKCKEVMNLQFLLPEVPGLGVWQVDSGSINSIININSTAELIKSIYKRIAMIPLLLTLEPREVNNPETKKKQTVYCLNLRINSKLSDLALEARKQSVLLELPVGDDEAPDFAPEFEPDPVELPPDNHTAQEDIDELFGPGTPSDNEAQQVTTENARARVAETMTKTSPAEIEPPIKPKRDITKIKTITDFYNAVIADAPVKRFPTKLSILTLAGKTETDIADPAAEYLAVMEKVSKEVKAA
jgi:hypothetical protein